MASIEALGAREILDSRGNPTVEVEVALDGRVSSGVEDLAGAERLDAGHGSVLLACWRRHV